MLAEGGAHEVAEGVVGDHQQQQDGDLPGARRNNPAGPQAHRRQRPRNVCSGSTAKLIKNGTQARVKTPAKMLRAEPGGALQGPPQQHRHAAGQHREQQAFQAAEVGGERHGDGARP